MSIASPPRRSAAPAAGRAAMPSALWNAHSLRTPDTSSPAVMTRRAWWLVVLNFLLPGSAQTLAGHRRLGRVGLVSTFVLWGLVVVLVVLAALSWTSLVSILANWFVLLLAQVILLAYAVLWIVLTIDTLRLVRLVKTRPRARVGIAALAVALVVVSSGGAVYASQVAGSARDAISTVFGGGPSVPPSDGYYNFLLLGADSGGGRDHMLFDSISVVSVNADSGAVTITGIPRDMRNVPFSDGPMQERYPNGHEGHADATCGWDNKINQLNTEVGLCLDGEAMYPDAAAIGSTPGIEATRDAAEGVLGIEIPYFVFVDMDGFAALIDALGGVDITVAERLPTGALHKNADGSLSGIKGWIEAGAQHMDGDTAQWYARSRYTTSDYDRMKRQRQLQAAILDQFTPATVLTRFQDISKAGSEIVHTDIPASMLSYLADLAVKAKEQEVSTIELTHENGVDPDSPDFAYIHELVDETLHPVTPTPTPGGDGQ
ncbi:MAG: LCP family protein [Candidatus Microbacterium phytovorans]|uniref:LCP family protein n=1 Tax=Candidatus Microbacterium phytovorans TaxID=3121374 RepID=A0AAJ6B461_9MICO|nr:LCP family protein [Microbacterium sp.]WEK13789.1 MAG: LCP family protein [Microbacterium sp.]